jgi:hypothetical protein
MGTKFRDDVARLVDELRTAIGGVGDKEYRQPQQFRVQHAAGPCQDLRPGRSTDVALCERLWLNLAACARQVIDSDAFGNCREATGGASGRDSGVRSRTGRLFTRCRWHRETHEKVNALKRAATKVAIDALINELKKTYENRRASGYPSSKDVIERRTSARGTAKQSSVPALVVQAGILGQLSRYHVNVLNGHGRAPGADHL